MNKHLSLLLLLFAGAPALAQQPVPLRVATYQLSAYDSSAGERRNDALKDVIRHVHPDILLVEGIENTTAFDNFFGGAFLGTAEQSMSVPFTEGNGMFYDAAHVSFAGHRAIRATSGRIDEFVVVPRGGSDTIHILACDLSGPDGTPATREERMNAAGMILARAAEIPNWHHTMVVGDLHLHGADDPVYQLLTAGATSGGTFTDPLAPVSDWQAGATENIPGGTGERSDIILISRSLALKYTTGSYAIPGNDAPGGARTPGGVLEALRRGSSHLPVQADFTFPAVAAAINAPLPERPTLSLQRDLTSFSQPKPLPTDFPSIMLQRSLEQPKLDIFGTTFGLGGISTAPPTFDPKKGWGPPPGAPAAPTGRNAEP